MDEVAWHREPPAHLPPLVTAWRGGIAARECKLADESGWISARSLTPSAVAPRQYLGHWKTRASGSIRHLHPVRKRAVVHEKPPARHLWGCGVQKPVA
jgi:hypothetical protein